MAPSLLQPGIEPPLKMIIWAVADAAGVGTYEIVSPRRELRLVTARRCYYRLARQLTSNSLAAIGRACGDRDHTTVLAGLHNGDVPAEFTSQALLFLNRLQRETR